MSPMVRRTLEQALAEHQAGRLAEAEALYRKVLASEPGNADALHLLGVLAHQAGNSAAGLELIEHAIAIDPRVADFHHHRSQVLLALGRADEALAAAQRAVELGPGMADGHRAAGDALGEMGRHDEAIAAFDRALAIDPRDRDALAHLGVSLCVRERFAEAAEVLARALTITPDADAWLNLGVAQHKLGRVDRAGISFKKVLEINPQDQAALANLALALWAAGKIEEAIAAYDQLIALRPNNAQAHAQCGVLLAMQDRLGEGLERLRRALTIDPENAEFVTDVGCVYVKQGRVGEALAAFERAVALDDRLEMAWDNWLLALHYGEELGPREIFEEHRRWGERYEEFGAEGSSGGARDSADSVSPLTLPLPSGERGRRLRVAYVSPDLRGHAVGYFVEPILGGHDRQGFEVFVYADEIAPDAVTARLRRSAEHWVDVHGWTSERVAQRVRDDRIDILVDLAGHTAGNRMAVFALKPAPVQVTYLGYPNTTGLRAIDWRITDAVADPLGGDSDGLNVETLWRTARTAWCYRPASEAPEVAPAPAQTSEWVTLGSFNVLAKISPCTMRAWAEILRRAPTTKLLIKAQALGDEDSRTALAARLAAQGVSMDRVELRAGEKSHVDHLKLYGSVDLALDPFPYNGTTTTCEAMWMGVPVLTLGGKAHVGRVGASLVSCVGLAEMVAESVEDYVERAVRLAGDSRRLAELRSGMRQRMRGSSLMDETAFVRELEEAYRQMWRRGRDG